MTQDGIPKMSHLDLKVVRGNANAKTILTENNFCILDLLFMSHVLI